MAMTTPSRKERAAAVANGLFAPLAKRQLLAGLGDVVHKKVPLSAIEPNPRQPRQAVDETSAKFDDLVGSIRQQGLIQPISLWQLDEDDERYLLIAGERRWRAFRRLAVENPAEYSRIPATVTALEGEQPAARALAESRGVAVVAATPRSVKGASDDEILLTATPLGRLVGRSAVPREELAEILIATCQDMGIWPTGAEQPPS